MLILASEFSTLPEGCPVLWGAAPSVVMGRHGATEYRIQIPGRFRTDGWLPTTTAAGESQLRVDLSTPAAVRAFAPALICAVRGLPSRPRKEPYPLWDDGLNCWLLMDYIGGEADGFCGIAYEPGREEVKGDTPEACLLAGLKAALDAAKGAE